jgi:hypothetical protein
MSWTTIVILVLAFICVFEILYSRALHLIIIDLEKEDRPLSHSSESESESGSGSEPGWFAQLSKRGLKPAQSLYIGKMDEGDAIKFILRMGYRPEDIKSLEYLQK